MQIRIDFSWMWVQVEVVGMSMYEPYDDSLLASDVKINYFMQSVFRAQLIEEKNENSSF